MWHTTCNEFELCFQFETNIVSAHASPVQWQYHYSYGLVTETPPVIETLNEKSLSSKAITTQKFESLSDIHTH